jgi:hypothetical protein
MMRVSKIYLRSSEENRMLDEVTVRLAKACNMSEDKIFPKLNTRKKKLNIISLLRKSC